MTPTTVVVSASLTADSTVFGSIRLGRTSFHKEFNMMTRSIRVAAMMLAAFSLAVATSPASQADQVAATRFAATGYTIDLYGVNGPGGGNKTGQQLAQFWSKISDGGATAIGSDYGTTGAGSGEFRSYCIDLYHTISNSDFNEAEISVDSGPIGDDASPEHSRDMGKVGWLLSNFSAGVDTGAGWGVGALASLGTVAQRAAALQAAVWVAGFGVASYNTSNSAITAAMQYLVAQLGSNASVAGLINYPPPWNGTRNDGGFQSQDMAFAAAPEPSTFAIAGLGALAFAGRRLRRRRSS